MHSLGLLVLNLCALGCAHAVAAPVGSLGYGAREEGVLQLTFLAESPWGHVGDDLHRPSFLERFDTSVEVRSRRKIGLIWIFVGVGVGLVVALLVAAAFVARLRSRKSGAAQRAACLYTSDASVVLHRRYVVPPQQRAELAALLGSLRDSLRPQAEGLLHYGFTVDDASHTVYCRQAYKDAAGLRKHIDNVDSHLQDALRGVASSAASCEAHGPAAALQDLQDVLSPLGCKGFVSDAGNRVYSSQVPESWPAGVVGRSLLLCPRYDVPSDRMDDFLCTFDQFYHSMKPEDEGMLFFGFAVNRQDNAVICNGAFENADGLLQHLGNVDETLKAALSIGRLAGLEVHGPEAELRKLRQALEPLGCRFFVADSLCRTWIQEDQQVASVNVENAAVDELLKANMSRAL